MVEGKPVVEEVTRCRLVEPACLDDVLQGLSADLEGAFLPRGRPLGGSGITWT